MKNPYIGQADLEEIQQRCDAAVSHPGNDDRTRHELTPDTDLNELLKRYQPWEMPAREAFYGERDYTLDPHDAVMANQRAWDTWANAPAEVRRQFSSFGHFLNSYEAVQAEIRAAEASAQLGAEAGGGAKAPEGAPQPPAKGLEGSSPTQGAKAPQTAS